MGLYLFSKACDRSRRPIVPTRHRPGPPLAVLAVCAAAVALPSCVRYQAVEGFGLMATPTGPLVTGPLAPARGTTVQGGLTVGYVASPKAGDTPEASEAAAPIRARAAVSFGHSATFESSAWLDFAHRSWTSSTTTRWKPEQIEGSTSVWAGGALRKTIGGDIIGFRQTYELGLGSLAIATRDPKAAVGDTRAMKQGSATAMRIAAFGELTAKLAPNAMVSLGLGWQSVPYIRSWSTHIAGGAPDPLDSASAAAVIVGSSWAIDALTLCIDGFWHFSETVKGAAAAPVGMSLSVRY